MSVRSNDLDKGKPAAKRGRKARGLTPDRQTAQPPKGVLMALALLELAVPILSGSTYLPRSTVNDRGVDVPLTEVGDKKEVSA